MRRVVQCRQAKASWSWGISKLMPGFGTNGACAARGYTAARARTARSGHPSTAFSVRRGRVGPPLGGRGWG